MKGKGKNLNAVIEKYKEMNLSIIEIDGVVRKEYFSTILYGHIIDTDVRDTVDKINAVEGLVVSALQFKLEGELASTALLTIEMDVGKREYAYEKVMEIAKEKDFLVIDEV